MIEKNEIQKLRKFKNRFGLKVEKLKDDKNIRKKKNRVQKLPYFSELTYLFTFLRNNLIELQTVKKHNRIKRISKIENNRWRTNNEQRKVKMKYYSITGKYMNK